MRGPCFSRSRAARCGRWRSRAPKRIDDLPDVPTLKEAGADVDAVLWSGIFMPKATPPAIVKKLEAEFMRIAKLPDVIARLKPLGIDTVGNFKEEFRENPCRRYRAVGRSRQGRQYQDRAIASYSDRAASERRRPTRS